MTHSSSGGKASSIIAALFLTGFAAIWIGFVGTFDYMAMRGIQRQYASQTYPTVAGRVIESRVRVSRGRRSISYYPFIRYKYHVGGQAYDSSKLRAGITGGSGQTSAQRTVRAHPVGSAVTVYYNPAKPSEALLEPGVRGGDLLMPLFLLPFNLILLWIILSFIGTSLRGGSAAEAGGAKVVYRGINPAVRLPKTPAILVALWVGIPSWIIAIVVPFAVDGSDPTISRAMTAWLIAVIPPILAFLLARFRAASGRYDLVIDPVRRTLTLPMTFGRTTPVELASGSVQDIHIQEIITRTSKGGSARRYELWLASRGAQGNEERLVLAKMGSKKNAESLAQWIRDKAQIKAQSTEDSRWM